MRENILLQTKCHNIYTYYTDLYPICSSNKIWQKPWITLVLLQNLNTLGIRNSMQNMCSCTLGNKLWTWKNFGTVMFLFENCNTKFSSGIAIVRMYSVLVCFRGLRWNKFLLLKHPYWLKYWPTPNLNYILSSLYIEATW